MSSDPLSFLSPQERAEAEARRRSPGWRRSVLRPPPPDPRQPARRRLLAAGFTPEETEALLTCFLVNTKVDYGRPC
jgi:hypothetical protein